LSDEQIDEDPLMLLVRWSQIIGYAKRFNYCSRRYAIRTGILKDYKIQ